MEEFTGMNDIQEYVVRIRRELHQYPEVRFDLDRTLKLVKRELADIGLEIDESYGKSSVVTTVNSKNPGKTIAFRADMDALELEEDNDLPFRSKIKGHMHACGHDGHTAMLLGTAKLLACNPDKFSGAVRLLFQPSEEGPESGAKLMVEDGVMASVDHIIAFHLTNELPVGRIGAKKGPAMACATAFNIEIYGKGGHAGQPQNTIDTIALAAKMITEIQYIKGRQIDPVDPVVINIGSIQGGSTSNIVADQTVLSGTIRSFSMALNTDVLEKINHALELIVTGSGGTFELNCNQGLPPLINTGSIVDRGMQSFSKIVGEKNTIILERPQMGSEDFTYYNTDHEGAMFWLGSRNEDKGADAELHNPKFNFDEDALLTGVRCFVQYAVDQAPGQYSESKRSNENG